MNVAAGAADKPGRRGAHVILAGAVTSKSIWHAALF